MKKILKECAIKGILFHKGLFRVLRGLLSDDRVLHVVQDWLGNEWAVYGVTDYMIFLDGRYVGRVDRGVSRWIDEGGSGGAYRVYACDGTNLSQGVARVTVVPTAYALSDNYPNPFNPATSIQYSVISGQSPPHVSLKIYNLLGQEVRTLVDEVQEAGYYRVYWDGNDDRGEQVSSGMYFYRLTAGDFTAIKKMTLVK